MIALALIVIILFMVMVYEGARRVRHNNDIVRAELGDRYNPDVAGRPYRDAIVIAVLVIGTLIIVGGVLAKIAPLPGA